jgi:hypothetical protein
MTDSKQRLRQPSPAQLDLLRRLCDERDVTFANPQSFNSADEQIKVLLKLPRASREDRRRDRQALREEMAFAGDAASIRADELSGYGSTATWAGAS